MFNKYPFRLTAQISSKPNLYQKKKHSIQQDKIHRKLKPATLVALCQVQVPCNIWFPTFPSTHHPNKIFVSPFSCLVPKFTQTKPIQRYKDENIGLLSQQKGNIAKGWCQAHTLRHSFCYKSGHEVWRFDFDTLVGMMTWDKHRFFPFNLWRLLCCNLMKIILGIFGFKWDRSLIRQCCCFLVPNTKLKTAIVMTKWFMSWKIRLNSRVVATTKISIIVSRILFKVRCFLCYITDCHQ